MSEQRQSFGDPLRCYDIRKRFIHIIQSARRALPLYPQLRTYYGVEEAVEAA